MATPCPHAASLALFMIVAAAALATSGTAHADGHAFTLTEFGASPPVVDLGGRIQIVVRVTNIGDADARANVTLYANDASVNTFTTSTLRPGQSTRREITWTPNETGTFAVHLQTGNVTTEPITINVGDPSPGPVTIPPRETPTESTAEADGSEKQTPGLPPLGIVALLALTAWARRRR